jgi:hypothetical protein
MQVMTNETLTGLLKEAIQYSPKDGIDAFVNPKAGVSIAPR